MATTSTRPLRHDRVVLVGLMGAGKTTTALALARATGWPVRDSDDDIETRTGRTGAELAADEGVDALHRMEEALLVDALGDDPPSIVTAAGSVVESAEARRLLATSATVVWLDVPADELSARMATGMHRRSLDADEFEALLTRRRALLEEVADLHLDANQPPEQLAEAILAHLSTGPSGSRAS